MSDKQIFVAAFAAFYTVAIIAFGIWKARHRKASDEDYFLGGRLLGPWVTAFSGAASAESGWVLLGLVGTAYSTGISAFWLLPGTLAGYIFSWLIMGPRLRSASLRLGTITVPETIAALSDRYKGTIRIVASLIILVFLTAYAAAQFNAAGKALNGIFGLKYSYGVMIATGLVLSYIVFGGFRASVWADVLQALLKLSAVLITPVVAFVMTPDAFQRLADSAPNLLDWSSGHTGLAALGFVLGWVGIGLGYPGQPHVVSKFMAAESRRKLLSAGLIAMVWSHLIFSGAILLGLIVRAQIPSLADPEQALPIFAMNNLSVPVAALIVAGILAAVFSTASGQLLTSVSTLSYDILGRRANERSYIPWLNELTVIAIGLVAGGFALTQNRMIFTFVLYSWAALGASLGCALVGLLFFRRVSGAGVLACLIGGTATVVIWRAFPALSSVYELVPAFAVGLLLVRYVCPKQLDTGTPENTVAEPAE